MTRLCVCVLNFLFTSWGVVLFLRSLFCVLFWSCLGVRNPRHFETFKVRVKIPNIFHRANHHDLQTWLQYDYRAIIGQNEFFYFREIIAPVEGDLHYASCGVFLCYKKTCWNTASLLTTDEKWSISKENQYFTLLPYQSLRDSSQRSSESVTLCNTFHFRCENTGTVKNHKRYFPRVSSNFLMLQKPFLHWKWVFFNKFHLNNTSDYQIEIIRQVYF